jgi:hypothetical protein
MTQSGMSSEQAKAEFNKAMATKAIAPKELYKTETTIEDVSDRAGWVTTTKEITYPSGKGGSKVVTSSKDISRYAILNQAAKLSQQIYNKDMSKLTEAEYKIVEQQATADVKQARNVGALEGTKLQLLSQLTPEGYYGLTDIIKNVGYPLLRRGVTAITTPGTWDERAVAAEKAGQEALSELGAEMLTTRASTLADVRKHKEWEKGFLSGKAPPITDSPILYKSAQLGAIEGTLGIIIPAGLTKWTTSGVKAWRSGKIISGQNIGRVGEAGIGTGLTYVGYKQVTSGVEDLLKGKPSGAADIAFGAMMLKTGAPILGRSVLSEAVRLSPSYSVGLFGKEGIAKVKVPKRLQKILKTDVIDLKPIPSESITSAKYKQLSKGNVIQMHVTKGKLQFKKGFTTVKKITIGAGARRTAFGEFYLYTAPPGIKGGKPQSYLFYAGVAGEGKNVKTVSTIEGMYRKFMGEEVVSGKPLYARSYLIQKTPIAKLPKAYRKPFNGESKIAYEMRLAKYQRELAPKMTGVAPETYVSGGESQLILPPGTRLVKRKSKIWTTYGNLPIKIESLYVMPPKGVKFKKLKVDVKPKPIIIKEPTTPKTYYRVQERIRIKPRGREFERDRIIKRPRITERPRILPRPRIIPRQRIIERPRSIERPRITERSRVLERPRVIERPRTIERPRIIERPRTTTRPRIIPTQRTYYKTPKQQRKQKLIIKQRQVYTGTTKYKPSLVGVLSGKRISKAPLKTSGFDIRGILTKRKGGKKL